MNIFRDKGAVEDDDLGCSEAPGTPLKFRRSAVKEKLYLRRRFGTHASAPGDEPRIVRAERPENRGQGCFAISCGPAAKEIAR